MGVEVSVVLPAYNEAGRIEGAVKETCRALEGVTGSFEIIVAEDGSSDGTDLVARGLEERFGFVRHLHSDERLGRGRALNRAFRIAKGEILVYIDVDLATDMRHLSELIGHVRGGCDFVTGSRMLPESRVERPLRRGVASRGFNFLVRLFLGSGLYDHQCGFKAFRRDALFEVLDEVKAGHWFWDTEVLVRGQLKGFRVCEFPVVWRHGGATKVSLGRDVVGMGSQILRLWWELRRG